MTRFAALLIAFVSAALLFVVQPHLGRRLAPTVGGGPAVWNACLVFFQTALLLGYAYAFWLVRQSPRRAILLHAAVLLGSCLWMFTGSKTGTASFAASPTVQTLTALIATAALPAVALCATTPLLHRWAGGYRIYAASNAGSLLSLLAYPSVIEPNLGLDAQWMWWRWTFVGFAAAMIVSAVATNQSATRRTGHAIPPVLSHDVEHRVTDVPRSPSRWRWLFWSALPSALLVGATQRITEDVAGGPLLWLPPLALFLLASILAFADLSPSPTTFAWLLAVMLLARGSTAAISAVEPLLAMQIAVEMATLFAACWCSFAILYRLRPPDEEAAGFYFWLAFGGAIGGGLAALAAPHCFDSTAELPLALLLLGLFLPKDGKGLSLPRPVQSLYFTFVALIALQLQAGWAIYKLEAAVFLGAVGMLFATAFGRSPALGMSIGLLALLPLPIGMYRLPSRQVRTEFGVHTIFGVEYYGENLAVLRHGGVNHGWQNLTPGKSMEPLGYYHPESAVGQALAWRKEKSGGDVAVVGLGAGAALVHRRPDQRFVFLEIDPAVAEIASNRNLFTYLKGAKQGAEVRIGDGRLLLSKAPDESFATIFLDAFSGDAVPTHLLTKEAFAMYVRKLKPGGAIIVNITNWHVDLEAVVARAAESVGLKCVGKNQTRNRSEKELRPAPTACLILALDERTFADLPEDVDVRAGREWRRIQPSSATPLWTDDYCNVWSTLRWR